MLLLQKNGSDDFQTPPVAVKPLLDYIPKNNKILEPSQGKGYIVNYLDAS
jgi:alpha-glucuronidase